MHGQQYSTLSQYHQMTIPAVILCRMQTLECVSSYSCCSQYPDSMVGLHLWRAPCCCCGVGCVLLLFEQVLRPFTLLHLHLPLVHMYLQPEKHISSMTRSSFMSIAEYTKLWPKTVIEAQFFYLCSWFCQTSRQQVCGRVVC